MEQELEYLDVIAVGAHPDDCEIGCGGTLAALAQQGYRVGIVDLTDGEPTPNSPGPEVRLAEANRAAEMLGIAKRIVLDLPNRCLFDDFEARVKLATVFRKYRPQVVLGLLGKTPMASPDHWQASQITDAAIFYSRLSKWDQHFDGLKVHAVQRQLYYHLFYESDWSGQAPRQIVVDITTTLERKLAAVKCYETQFTADKGYIFDRVRSIAQSCGHAAGFDAGEVLTSAKTLGTQNLMRTLLLE